MFDDSYDADIDNEVPLSIGEAKARLYQDLPPVKSIAQAKAELFSDQVQYDDLGRPIGVEAGIVESKKALLARKSEQKKINVSGEVPAITPPQQPNPQENALLTDEQADSVLGGAANTAVGVFGGAAKVFSDIFLTSVPTLGNMIDSYGIEPEEFEIHKEIIGKRNAKIPLDEAEEQYLSEYQDNFDAITDINKKQEFIDAINTGVKHVQSWQNTTKQQVALKELGKDSEVAAKEFSDGNYFSAIGTYLKAAGKLAINNPAASVELLGNTLPQMIALHRAAAAGVYGLSTAQYEEAIQEFEKEHGRMPDDNEKAIALSLSTLSAGADLLGAKLVLGGKSLLQGVKQANKKLGLQYSTKLFKAAEGTVKKAIIETSKGAVKVTGSRPVTAFVGEGATEGAQNALNQLAAKQDISKLDAKEIISDSVVGSVIGGGLGSTGPVLDAVKIAAGAKESDTLNVVKDTVKTKTGKIGNLFKTTDEIITNSINDKDAETGFNALNEVDFNETSQEEHAAYLEKFIKLNIVLDEQTEAIKDKNDLAKVEEIRKKQENIQKVIFASYQAKYAKPEANTAVETIKDTKADKVEVKEAISTVTDNIGTSDIVSEAQVDEVLGSKAFQDSATPAQKEILETYKKHLVNQKAHGNRKNIDEVTDDIYQGSEDNIGINEHLSNMHLAISRGDTKQAQKTILELRHWRGKQIEKVNRINKEQAEGFKNNKSIHAPVFIEAINSDLDTIINTVRLTQNMYRDAFLKEEADKITTEVNNEFVNESKVKPESKAKDEIIPEVKETPVKQEVKQDVFKDSPEIRKNIIKQLKAADIKVTEYYDNLETKEIDAAAELTRIDNDLDICKVIRGRC
jgi:tetratricopeptide (TPR) repeat protein